VVKKFIVGAAALLTVAIVVPVLALPSVDMTVKVGSVALVGDCTSGMQTWDVALAVTVSNESEDVVVFERTGYFVKYRTPTAAETSYDVSVIDAGGFVAGEEVAADATRTFTPSVRTTIPCEATAADMFGTLDLVGRDKTFVDGDPFLAGGTPVPLGPTGALGIGAIAGGILLLAQRLGRRPKTLGSQVESR
jgi:hypothetical protein